MSPTQAELQRSGLRMVSVVNFQIWSLRPATCTHKMEIWLYLNLSISFYLDKSKSTDLSPNPAKPSSNSPMGKSPLWPFGVRGVTKM